MHMRAHQSAAAVGLMLAAWLTSKQEGVGETPDPPRNRQATRLPSGGGAL